MLEILMKPQDVHHFRARALEWWFAVYTFAFGFWIAAPWAAMETAAFDALLNWMPEPEWGLTFGLTGAAHLVSLWINGRRWWTPFTRATMTAVAIVPFALFAAGFAHTTPGATSVFTYGAISTAGLVCLYRAVKDGVHACIIRGWCNA